MRPGTNVGPYVVLDRLGAGGMGTVWKARDTRLNRMVAIKQIDSQFLTRISQEARAIAALNHPYICQIYDLGPNYLVLEYVEGKPLQGPMPPADAIPVIIQIVSALEEAHKVGILHRDLKPENILLTAKGVKLLDFGLAKPMDAEASQRVTLAGAILGSPCYMSPEQAQGRPLDARSDIFSLGSVMYEIVSGEPAFREGSMLETMNAVVSKDPAAIDTPLYAVIKKCLAKHPKQRFQTATELRQALEQTDLQPNVTRRIAPPETSRAGLWLNSLTGIGSVPAIDVDPLADPHSIAVLPLINISPHPDNDFICDGLAEELINGLTQFNDLRVVSRSSSFQCKGTTPDVRDIGRRLHARLLVHGSLRRSGDSVRLTMQLTDSKEGYQIWSQRFDAHMQDLFQLQDELTEAVLVKLREQLGLRIQARRHPANSPAYPIYLQARFAFNHETSSAIRQALELFQSTLQVDPDFVPALVGTAESLMKLEWYGLEPASEMVPRAKQALDRALRLDPDSVQGRCLLATIQASCDWNWADAAKNFEHALAAGPGVVSVLFHYGMDFLTPQGRLAEALEYVRKADKVDPLTPLTSTAVGGCYYRLRRWKEAVRSLRATLLAHPGFGHAYWSMGRALLELDEGESALKHFLEAARIMDNTPAALAELGYGYARVGRIEDARRIQAQLEPTEAQQARSPLHAALVHTGLGEADAAIACLEEAFQQRRRQLFWLNADPRFDPLRKKPAFQDLIARMGLPVLRAPVS